MPAATMNTVASSTRKMCRSDHSMMRASKSVLPGRLGGAPRVRRRFAVSMAAQAFQCRLQVALGVDQEIAVDDDPLARVQALDHLDVAVSACAEFDLARHECAATEI